MNSGGIHIDQLVVRTHGLTREQGVELGKAVARKLAEMKMRLEPRWINSLSLSVYCEGSSPSRMADRIALSIRSGLK
jgi:hypothetical protein